MWVIVTYASFEPGTCITYFYYDFLYHFDLQNAYVTMLMLLKTKKSLVVD